MKRTNILKYLSLAIVMALSFSCSDDKTNKKNLITTKVYDLNITPKLGVADSGMSELKKEVFNNLINKKPVNSADLTKLLIEEQVKFYNTQDSKSTTVEAVTNWINDISSITNEISNIEDVNVTYQNQKLNMNEMKYNKEAISLPYILNDNRLQCFSATLLHQLVLRSNANFEKFNSVVIYERGHILSGYMVKDGDTYKLIGIENTVKGKGIKKYNDLTNYSGKWIRIVDSNLFAIVEIFKNDITNLNEVVKQVLDQTAKQYNLDPKFNHDYDYVTKNETFSTPFKSNESPLAFGYSYVKDGDQDIETADEVENDNSDWEPGLTWGWSEPVNIVNENSNSNNYDDSYTSDDVEFNEEEDESELDNDYDYDFT